MLHKDFVKDGSLPDGPLDPRAIKCVEMRAILDDPIGQKYIGQFAKEAMTQASECGLFTRCRRPTSYLIFWS